MSEYRIGIDAGGTKVAYGLFDDDSRLIDRDQHPTPIDADGPALCDLMVGHVEGLLVRNHIAHENVRGVGVCMPSFILYDEGYIYMTSALVNIRRFAMRDYLKTRLDMPFIIDNDSNAAALAEYRFGAGRGSRHMVYMAVSTGFGAQNGKSFLSSTVFA